MNTVNNNNNDCETQRSPQRADSAVNGKGINESTKTPGRGAQNPTGESAVNDSVKNYMLKSMGTDMKVYKRDVRTGFAELDEKSGGLYAGLYTVAAISSLGKTTFCSQIADQLAEQKQDVIFFSLEQSRLEMVSKGIARIMGRKDRKTAVSSLAIRRGEGGADAIAAGDEYMKAVGDYLYIHEGNFNCNITTIREYIRNHIKQRNTRPVVFIDYLQIIQPDAGARTAKEATDTVITELKRLSRELGLTIFVISSVNRANYLTPIDFESLKESGGIEFTSDVVWGLQLQCLTNDPVFEKKDNIKDKREKVKQAKAESPRRIQLVCLKNRYGIANFTCDFEYYPENDLFQEPWEDPETQKTQEDFDKKYKDCVN